MRSRTSTPKWTRPPASLVALFGSVLEGLPGAELRQMFGCPVAFVSGNMFSGLHQDRMMLRLSEADRQAFCRAYAAKLFEPIPGRVMREYVVLPASLVQSEGELTAWVKRGYRYAASLPAKTRRTQKRVARGKSR